MMPAVTHADLCPDLWLYADLWRASRSSILIAHGQDRATVLHVLNRERPSAPLIECPSKCSQRFLVETSFGKKKKINPLTSSLSVSKTRGAARSWYASQLHSGRGHEHPIVASRFTQARFRE